MCVDFCYFFMLISPLIFITRSNYASQSRVIRFVLNIVTLVVFKWRHMNFRVNELISVSFPLWFEICVCVFKMEVWPEFGVFEITFIAINSLFSLRVNLLSFMIFNTTWLLCIGKSKADFVFWRIFGTLCLFQKKFFVLIINFTTQNVQVDDLMLWWPTNTKVNPIFL